VPVGLLVVLFDNFLETRVVELRELGQVVYVRDDVREVFLQQQVFVLGRRIFSRALVAVGSLCPCNCLAYFFLASRDPANNLLALHLLERKYLVQLLLQLVDEALLIFLVPFLLGLSTALLKALLELVVGDVVVVPVFDE
jgi:predicted DNA repair protein MutK